MWPKIVPWTDLRFGVECEFVGGDATSVPLLDGWVMQTHEVQYDEDGRQTGGELLPPPLRWTQRAQIRTMLARLRKAGARANWDCGLHVHVGLEPWGEAMVLPLVDAALTTQEALAALLQTPDYRRSVCPPLTAAMRVRYAAQPGREALRRFGRPEAHRCGINAAAWYDKGTVEIRYGNGSLVYSEVARTVALCLRVVAAVGAGRALPADPAALAQVLAVPLHGYPPPQPVPLWRRRQVWLEEALRPALDPLALADRPGAEVHHLEPEPGGAIAVLIEHADNRLERRVARWQEGQWHVE